MGFRENRIKAKNRDSSRLQNSKDERPVVSVQPLMCFSFKDFDRNQCPPGQTYETWQEEELLAYMITKFGYVCQCSVQEAIQRGFVKIYGDFPPRSDFKVPQFIEGEVKWAVVMDIKGQKARVAGYIADNVFYVVFLDRDHVFYKMKNK